MAFAQKLTGSFLAVAFCLTPAAFAHKHAPHPVASSATPAPKATAAAPTPSAVPMPTAVPTPTAAPARKKMTLSVGVDAGTPGLGVTVGVPLGQNVDVRTQTGELNYTTSFSSNDNKYTGALRTHSFAAFLDYHPLAGAFMITTGILQPNLSFEAAADGSFGLLTLNNHIYTTAQTGTVTGAAKWNSTAPYVGLGWGPIHRRRGVAVGLDLGAAFLAAPDVTIDASAPSAKNDPVLQADLAAERQSIRDAAKKITVYPVLNLSLQITL